MFEAIQNSRCEFLKGLIEKRKAERMKLNEDWKSEDIVRLIKE